MRDMAKATGHHAERYTTLLDRIRTAYQAAYVKPDGAVDGDTQSGYLLTLYAGLAPDGLHKAMTGRLVANIAAHHDHLTTGFLGTPFLLFALSDNGRTDIAYDLLMQETYPSWGYMVAKGATTWWERWNGDTGDPAMNSYNHYSFGSVMAWVYRDTVGIDADPAAPGFKHLLIHPHFTDKLTYARGEYDSIYGAVLSNWKRTPAGAIDWSLTIPANATASVTLENKAGANRVVELGSGTYRFVDGVEMAAAK
jgi:alpha-L-rhamnosidase